MKGILSAVLFVLVYAALPSQLSAQDCPIGSHPWVDNWGNRICKSFQGGRTTEIEGTLEKCPVGTYSWVDNWGNRICKSFQGGQEFHDTSKGCPIGTHPWVDKWGNAVCKKF
jgi:hypothetical protein